LDICAHGSTENSAHLTLNFIYHTGLRMGSDNKNNRVTWYLNVGYSMYTR